jgi:phosphorylcholine metabolism protein LicD
MTLTTFKFGEKIPDDYCLPKLHTILLKAMLFKIHTEFKKSNISYFLDGGSCLGAMREKDIIPTDDDIDLGIFEKDVSKIKQILSSNIHLTEIQIDKEIYVIKFVEDIKIMKLYIENLWVENKVTKIIFGTPTIDFFVYRKAGENVKLENRNLRLQFQNCVYKKEEMFPLKLRQFGEIEAYTPNNPIPFLKRYYGNDCLEIIKVDLRKADNPREKIRGE